MCAQNIGGVVGRIFVTVTNRVGTVGADPPTSIPYMEFENDDIM